MQSRKRRYQSVFQVFAGRGLCTGAPTPGRLSMGLVTALALGSLLIDGIVRAQGESHSRDDESMQEPTSTPSAPVLLTPVQRAAPDFEYQDPDGDTWSLESLAGKIWVVNFWASWCPPCIEEMPSMNTALAQFDTDRFGMLGINAGESIEVIESFLSRVTVDFPVVLGGFDALQGWSVRGLPTTVIVDRSGQVVFEAVGPRDWANESIIDLIESLAQ